MSVAVTGSLGEREPRFSLWMKAPRILGFEILRVETEELSSNRRSLRNFARSYLAE